MAHLLFDERSLQEIRLVRGRLVRSLTHNDCIVAQFHTSNVKLAFSSIVQSKMSTSNHKDKGANRPSSPTRRLTSPGSPQSPNTQHRKNAIIDMKSHALSAMQAWSEATSNKMNVNSEGFYFFNEALLPISTDYILDPNQNLNTDYDPSSTYLPTPKNYNSRVSSTPTAASLIHNSGDLQSIGGNSSAAGSGVDQFPGVTPMMGR
eukprot:gene28829-35761_t